MYLRKASENITPAFMDIRTLAAYLSIGITAARELGQQAGAVRHIGRRVVYDRNAIDKFMADKD